jgi:putative membrane protein
MEENRKNANAGDHLANERTYLAWVRTSIGIMAFGFVVVKFSLFIRQISLILDKKDIVQSKGYSSIMGILLVIAGATTALLSYLRYKRTEKQLTEGTYKNSSWLIPALTFFLIVESLVLIVYLILSAW